MQGRQQPGYWDVEYGKTYDFYPPPEYLDMWRALGLVVGTIIKHNQGIEDVEYGKAYDLVAQFVAVVVVGESAAEGFCWY